MPASRRSTLRASSHRLRLSSNIFNIGAVLGISGLVAPSGLPVAASSLVLDIPVMILVALACLPVFLTRYTVSRSDGVAFLLCYVAYVTYLIMSTQHSPMLAATALFEGRVVESQNKMRRST